MRRISEENHGTPVVFVLDGAREDIYRGTFESSSVAWQSDMLRDACRRNGVHYLDLSPAFLKHFQVHGQRFDQEIAGHWNRLGDEVAAAALYDYLFSRSIIRAPASSLSDPAGRRIGTAEAP